MCVVWATNKSLLVMHVDFLSLAIFICCSTLLVFSRMFAFPWLSPFSGGEKDVAGCFFVNQIGQIVFARLVFKAHEPGLSFGNVLVLLAALVQRYETQKLELQKASSKALHELCLKFANLVPQLLYTCTMAQKS